ncbi:MULTISPECIES: hypothetical protein [unclassified Frigoribacterium]|uniref:hypothetical protein n=1 Tax=unclassified Frigoribacterium TaxID=2627005 RepID=UPI00105B38C2|nr:MULTISPECIES: hypothetical protein [unclassified Frigoribacterium]MBD8584672.1 hypothetical protein [Frigoribacterium sp. CFBP 8766]MBD8609430.1 hypothetical protein [Frigoribacterium sp. CFBP 13729]MBF4578530.1 hypothetical protein [Frigoribacterium sp. VKM Ac-2530]TDT65797.1 hypothetical protein EDF20_0594 [Frigoribacterium sp. PhB116]TWX40511.1 hypothetical protein ES689_03420 [Frigoribacterium sp. ACAM 257]
MIEWFTWAQVIVACVAGLVCLVAGFSGKLPNDITVGATALVLLLLLVQLVVAIVAPFAGNPPTGNVVEFYIYLVSAILLPPLAVVWALVDRTRWSNLVLAAAVFAVAVMVYRMLQIWTVQVA